MKKVWKHIAITNQELCSSDFLDKVRWLSNSKLSGYDVIILREKMLSEEAYRELASQVLSINQDSILHNFIDVAISLRHDKIHLPMPRFRTMNNEERSHFSIIGVSIHSLEEAVEAQKLGATYVIYGHVFQTECKKGLEPRGLLELQMICKKLTIPVYGLGGINEENEALVFEAGASGVCQMSGAMQ